MAGNDDPTPIRCFGCGGGETAPACPKCDGVGFIYWVYGRAYPATDKGKLYARARVYRNERTAPG